MELRKQREQEFHDRLRKGILDQRWSAAEVADPLWSNMKYYSVERASRSFAENWLRARCANKRVLDYACGNGEDAVFVAKHGAAHAVGIDLSEVSIQNCCEKAQRDGVEGRTTFQVMDAESLQFEDNSFDLVVEYGALHHLDLSRAFSEVRRVLKPDGAMLCTEALRHNPFIHLYRKLTPSLRTEWEVGHILTRRDILGALQYFGKIEVHWFHLATLLAVPFRKGPAFPCLLTLTEAVDRFILRIPGLRWWAWQVVFILSEPRK